MWKIHLILLFNLLYPVFSIIDDEFQCHPMAVKFNSYHFTELFWASISGDYISETLYNIPVPDNLTKTRINLKTSEFELNLILELPRSIIHPNARVVVTEADGEQHEPSVYFSPHCFLSGYPEHGSGIASVSYCQGWRGIVTINDTDYQFEPPHPNCANDLTLVGKRTSSLIMEQVKKQESVKSKNYTEFKMEVGVFYDQQMNDILEKRLRAITLEQKLNYLVTEWNSVQYEFNKQILLEGNIQIVIKYIHFFKKNPTWYRIDNQLSNGMGSVCGWAYRNDLKLDHIHITTGWSTGKYLGIGGSSGICNSDRCAISKKRDWGDPNSISHEIAHGVGIPHDDHPNCNGTKGPHGLMGKRNTGWSKCSVKYFKLWLESGRGKCLVRDDVQLPKTTKRKESVSVDTYGNGLLPAMYHNRDRYCEENFGKGFRYVSLYPSEVCEIQSCAILEPGPLFGALRVDTEGINGLYCGLGKVCRLNLQCENITQANIWVPIPMQIGGWSTWSPYSKCSTTCGLGYRYSRRTCDNPRPINAEWCSGDDVRIRVCNLQPCENESSDLQSYLRERAAQTCAMLVDNKFIDGKKFSKNGTTYSNISLSLKYFRHNPYRSIRGYNNMGRLRYVSPEECATACFKRPRCQSFEYKKSHRKCDFSSVTVAGLSFVNNKYWDYYEIASHEINFFQRSRFKVVVGYENRTRARHESVSTCASACLRDQSCRVFVYHTLKRTCFKFTSASYDLDLRANTFWDLYEITDDVSGKEGLCEVQCDPINPMDDGKLGHVGFMPDGTSCGSTIDSEWRCLSGKCRKIQTRTFKEIPYLHRRMKNVAATF